MYEDAILEWAERHGFQTAWGPVGVLDDIRKALGALKVAGGLDPDFVRDRIAWFFEDQESPLENPKSLLLVAVPRPTHSVSFETSAGAIRAILPPTYVNYRATMEEVREGLREEVFSANGRLELCFAPLKSAATLMGLAKYGRNNITYVPGMGSYHELVGMLTDVELTTPPGSGSKTPEHLAECDSCDRCIRSCPTRAIPGDRFLIRAERCLTNYNESSEPLPDHVPMKAHHCLIGCMVCQRVCPLNKGKYRVESTGVSFDRKETDVFLSLKKESTDSASRAVSAKFERLGLTEDTSLLGRNLRALIEKQDATLKGTA